MLVKAFGVWIPVLIIVAMLVVRLPKGNDVEVNLLGDARAQGENWWRYEYDKVNKG